MFSVSVGSQFIVLDAGTADGLEIGSSMHRLVSIRCGNVRKFLISFNFILQKKESIDRIEYLWSIYGFFMSTLINIFM